MSRPVDYRPDPLTPEHQLIRDAAVLPKLSRELRGRVMVQCQGQVRAARWKRRLTFGGALVAVVCLMFVIMNAPENSHAPVTVEQTPAPLPLPETPSYLSPGTQNPVVPVPSGDRNVPGTLKQGAGNGAGNIAGSDQGVEPTPEVKQNKAEPKSSDDINLLIDELHRRNRRLCGMFLW